MIAASIIKSDSIWCGWPSLLWSASDSEVHVEKSDRVIPNFSRQVIELVSNAKYSSITISIRYISSSGTKR